MNRFVQDWLRPVAVIAVLSLGAVGCADDESSRSEVLFRGLGQEPGWTITVFPDTVEFVGNYGRRTLRLPRAATTVDTTARRFAYTAEAESHQLRAVIEEETCTDVMSGEAFRYTVTVTVDGRSYDGCGQVLP